MYVLTDLVTIKIYNESICKAMESQMIVYQIIKLKPFLPHITEKRQTAKLLSII